MAAVLLALLADNAVAQQPYSIAVMGDLPYIRSESDRAKYLPRYERLLANIDSANVQVVIHLGDFTTGPLCGDSTVDLRYREFSRSRHPFVYIPGDNDWRDCGRGGFDPLERLSNLRRVFFQGNESLGQNRIALTRQSANPAYRKFRENVRWTMGNELYVALNVTGSANNIGNVERPNAEYVERNAANIAWLREAFACASKEQRRGIAIFIQANPGLEGLPENRKAGWARGFEDFNRELRTLAIAFGKPVLLVHGDTHYFRVDIPYYDAHREIVPNITRVEGFGDYNYHWVRISVDPKDPHVFRITPEIIPENTR